jgi:hypothetical protein
MAGGVDSPPGASADGATDDALVARLATGGAVGVAAWGTGLAITFAVVRVVGLGEAPVDGERIDPSDADTVSVLGLIFFGAHLVDTELRPPLTDGFNFVTELAETVDPAYSVLFLVPLTVLVVAGAALATIDGSVLIGPALVAGYLPPSALGAVLFAATADAGVVSVGLSVPTRTGVVLAGAVYPIVFGAVGSLAAHGLGLTRG